MGGWWQTGGRCFGWGVGACERWLQRVPAEGAACCPSTDIRLWLGDGGSVQFGCCSSSWVLQEGCLLPMASGCWMAAGRPCVSAVVCWNIPTVRLQAQRGLQVVPWRHLRQSCTPTARFSQAVLKKDFVAAALTIMMVMWPLCLTAAAVPTAVLPMFVTTPDWSPPADDPLHLAGRADGVTAAVHGTPRSDYIV